ncbi:MAG: hypothetical protein EPO02_00395 [Nitrospirae bacterium]|nr:MAG: hypothetical protein EPO02_00395 [Nitrospirota bacterium]
MEAKEASAVRKAWGDKPCAHPWWVEETMNGTDTGKVVCKTCGRARRKGEPEPAPAKGKTAKPAPPAQPVKQQVKELDPAAVTVVQRGKDPVARAAPLNQKVQDLESAVDGITAMLGADFAFTTQEEANLASGADKLRDALGRWRERKRKKKRSP